MYIKYAIIIPVGSGRNSGSKEVCHVQGILAGIGLFVQDVRGGRGVSHPGSLAVVVGKRRR